MSRFGITAGPPEGRAVAEEAADGGPGTRRLSVQFFWETETALKVYFLLKVAERYFKKQTWQTEMY